MMTSMPRTSIPITAPIQGTVIELKPHERSESVQTPAIVMMAIAGILAALSFLGKIDSALVFSPILGAVLALFLRHPWWGASLGLTWRWLPMALAAPLTLLLSWFALWVPSESQNAFGMLPIAGMACITLTGTLILKPTPSRLGMMGASITVLLLVELAINQSLLSSLGCGLIFFLMWSALACRRNPDLGDRRPKSLRGMGQGLGTALFIVISSAPLIVASFLLFPRLPLDAIRSEMFVPNAGNTGLSDSLTLGSISELRKSTEPAFVASFKTQSPAEPSLYWRSIVLDKLVGQKWVSSAQKVADASAANEKLKEKDVGLDGPQTDATKDNQPKLGVSDEKGEKDNLILYDEIIDPNNRSLQIAVLDNTKGKVFVYYDEQDSSGLEPLSDGTYSILGFLKKKNRNTHKIHALQGAAGADGRFKSINTINETDQIPATFLELPASFNPKTQAFGRQLKETWKSPQRVVDAVLQKIQREDYHYTLKPTILGKQAIDDFFFETRAGFCEHYASAFVVLMRSAGIPARLVTGYLSGPAKNNSVAVSQGDAHAWVEVWLTGRGWVRQDPTASIDPSRVDPDAGNARLESSPNGFLGFLHVTWRKKTANAELFWKNTMLEFDSGTQSRIFQQMGIDQFGRPLLIGAAILLMVGCVVAWQVIGAMLARMLGPSRGNSLSILLEKRCASIAQRLPEQTWRDYARRSKSLFSHGDYTELQALIAEYEWIIYGQGEQNVQPKARANAIINLASRMKSFRPKKIKSKGKAFANQPHMVGH